MSNVIYNNSQGIEFKENVSLELATPDNTQPKKRRKKKLLFSSTLREIKYLIDNDYLNKKGLEWANNFFIDVEEQAKSEPNSQDASKSNREDTSNKLMTSGNIGDIQHPDTHSTREQIKEELNKDYS